MCKIVGIVMVIFADVGFIYSLIWAKRAKTRNLKEIKKAIAYMKNELAFSMSEMACLCERTSEKTTGEISSVFRRVSKYMYEDYSLGFYSAWKKACDGKSFFSEETEEAISELFDEFGRKSLEIELHNVSRTQHILEEREKEEERKYQSDRKLICMLGTAFCAVVIIIAI